MSVGQDVLLDELRVLVARRDSGELAPEEFERQAARLLTDGPSAPGESAPASPTAEAPAAPPSRPRVSSSGFTAAPTPGSAPAVAAPEAAPVRPPRWNEMSKDNGPGPQAALSAAPTGFTATPKGPGSGQSASTATPRTQFSAAPTPQATTASNGNGSGTLNGGFSAAPTGGFSATPAVQVAPRPDEAPASNGTEKRRLRRLSRRGRHTVSERPVQATPAVPAVHVEAPQPFDESIWVAAPSLARADLEPAVVADQAEEVPVEDEPTAELEAVLEDPSTTAAEDEQIQASDAASDGEPEADRAEATPVSQQVSPQPVAPPGPAGPIEPVPAAAQLGELLRPARVEPAGPVPSQPVAPIRPAAAVAAPIPSESAEPIRPASAAAAGKPSVPRWQQRRGVEGSYWDTSGRVVPPSQPVNLGPEEDDRSLQGTYWDFSRRVTPSGPVKLGPDDAGASHPGGYWDKSTIHRKG